MGSLERIRKGEKMAARKNVSVRTIVGVIDLTTRALENLRDGKGVDQKRLNVALKALQSARKTCMDECMVVRDFSIFPRPGRGK